MEKPIKFIESWKAKTIFVLLYFVSTYCFIFQTTGNLVDTKTQEIIVLKDMFLVHLGFCSALVQIVLIGFWLKARHAHGKEKKQ